MLLCWLENINSSSRSLSAAVPVERTEHILIDTSLISCSPNFTNITELWNIPSPFYLYSATVPGRSNTEYQHSKKPWPLGATIKPLVSIDEIIKIFDEFVPFSDDDSINDNERFLSTLMGEWDKSKEKEKAIPAIFHLMERFPHSDFGSPGPLVHGLEATGTKLYEAELHKSLIRKPTPLTLWMYNRIINDENDSRIIKGHYDRLMLFSKHPLIDSETRKTAEIFIDHQQQRL